MPHRTIPLIEPSNTPEFFVNGIGRIEDACGDLRFTFYALHKPMSRWHGPVTRVARVHLVASPLATHRAIMQASEAVQEIKALAREMH